MRVPGTRARVPCVWIRTAARVCRRDVNVCNHKLESFVMATAPPASYPGNALLCHCVERRKEGGREESGEIHPRSGEPPSTRSSSCHRPRRREIGWNDRATPWTLIPSIATRGPTNSAWPSPNYLSLHLSRVPFLTPFYNANKRLVFSFGEKKILSCWSPRSFILFTQSWNFKWNGWKRSTKDHSQIDVTPLGKINIIYE